MGVCRNARLGLFKAVYSFKRWLSGTEVLKGNLPFFVAIATPFWREVLGVHVMRVGSDALEMSQLCAGGIWIDDDCECSGGLTIAWER